MYVKRGLVVIVVVIASLVVIGAQTSDEQCYVDVEGAFSAGKVTVSDTDTNVMVPLYGPSEKVATVHVTFKPKQGKAATVAISDVSQKVTVKPTNDPMVFIMTMPMHTKEVTMNVKWAYNSQEKSPADFFEQTLAFTLHPQSSVQVPVSCYEPVCLYGGCSETCVGEECVEEGCEDCQCDEEVLVDLYGGFEVEEVHFPVVLSDSFDVLYGDACAHLLLQDFSLFLECVAARNTIGDMVIDRTSVDSCELICGEEFDCIYECGQQYSSITGNVIGEESADEESGGENMNTFKKGEMFFEGPFSSLTLGNSNVPVTVTKDKGTYYVDVTVEKASDRDFVGAGLTTVQRDLKLLGAFPEYRGIARIYFDTQNLHEGKLAQRLDYTQTHYNLKPITYAPSRMKFSGNLVGTQLFRPVLDISQSGVLRFTTIPLYKTGTYTTIIQYVHWSIPFVQVDLYNDFDSIRRWLLAEDSGLHWNIDFVFRVHVVENLDDVRVLAPDKEGFAEVLSGKTKVKNFGITFYPTQSTVFFYNDDFNEHILQKDKTIFEGAAGYARFNDAVGTIDKKMRIVATLGQGLSGSDFEPEALSVSEHLLPSLREGFAEYGFSREEREILENIFTNKLLKGVTRLYPKSVIEIRVGDDCSNSVTLKTRSKLGRIAVERVVELSQGEAALVEQYIMASLNDNTQGVENVESNLEKIRKMYLKGAYDIYNVEE